jgi:hypothetical protein
MNEYKQGIHLISSDLRYYVIDKHEFNYFCKHIGEALDKRQRYNNNIWRIELYEPNATEPARETVIHAETVTDLLKEIDPNMEHKVEAYNMTNKAGKRGIMLLLTRRTLSGEDSVKLQAYILPSNQRELEAVKG